MISTNSDLQKMGLSPLSEFQIQNIEGGSLPGLLRDVFSAVSDIAVGFVTGVRDGFNSVTGGNN